LGLFMTREHYEQLLLRIKTIDGLLGGVPQTVRVYRDALGLNEKGDKYFLMCTAISFNDSKITLYDGSTVESDGWDVHPDMHGHSHVT